MNTEQTLNSKEIYSFGFKNAKKHFWSFFVLFIVYMILNALGGDEKSPMTLMRGIGELISLVGSIYLGISLTAAVLKIARGETVTMKTFFTWPTYGFKSLWTGIVSGLALFIPIVLCIVLSAPFFAGVTSGKPIVAIIGLILSIPVIIFTIYLAIRIIFSKFYALETGSWAMVSIKKSFAATKGKVGRLIILAIISLGVVLLGVIALFIGLLWAIPTVVLAQVYIYTLLFPKQNNMNNLETEVIVQPTEIPAHTMENEMSMPAVENNINNTNI